jgi:hypothetical protein
MTDHRNESDSAILVRSAQAKRTRYSMEQLFEEHEANALDDTEWLDAKAVGRELL